MKIKDIRSAKQGEQLICDLHQLFPEQAARMIAQLAVLNGKSGKLPVWRQKQLESFVTMLGLSAMDLERAYREGRRGTCLNFLLG
jgi:hypothetical protein